MLQAANTRTAPCAIASLLSGALLGLSKVVGRVNHIVIGANGRAPLLSFIVANSQLSHRREKPHPFAALFSLHPYAERWGSTHVADCRARWPIPRRQGADFKGSPERAARAVDLLDLPRAGRAQSGNASPPAAPARHAQGQIGQGAMPWASRTG